MDESLFSKDAVVYMMRDGELVCPICGAVLVDNKCLYCEPIEILEEL